MFETGYCERQLITPTEFAFAIAHGNAGGRLLAERLADAGLHHIVRLRRPSVV